ncbi:MAG: phage protein Gp27 family protein [Pseudomonadota bacterium]
MGGKHTKIRRHSKVEDELPPEIRKEVNRLLIEGEIYEDISDYLKGQGHDISRSSIGRYGKDFLNEYRKLLIIEDKSKILVSEVGGDGMVLEEAVAKKMAATLLELLLEEGIDIKETPRIISDFAKLQSSSTSRERAKMEFKKKAETACKNIKQKASKAGLSPEVMGEIEKEILGLVR